MKIDFEHWKGSQIGDQIIDQLNLEQSLAIIKNLNPDFSKDGNQWCYLYGELPNNCIVGFGTTPFEAMDNFVKKFLPPKGLIMLKPQELFIGAAVNYIDTQGIDRKIQLDKEHMIWMLEGELGFMCNHTAIPLTTEILTDWCGWENIYESKYRILLWCEPKSEFKFEFFKLTKTISLTWYGHHTQIQYLHQLQALYALLTGEVMPINLPKN